MPTKNTTVLAARVVDTEVEEINQRLKKRRITRNQWLNWAIQLGLRRHKKKINGVGVNNERD